MVDSQFINVFYRTDLGTPNDFQMSLFVLFVALALVINTILLNLVKRTDRQQRIFGHIPLNAAYIGTIAIQYAMFLILFVMIAEMLILDGYNKELSLIVVCLSHIWAATMLAFLFLRFIQWFEYVRSVSLLVYGVIFIVVIFLIIITIPLFTDQYRNQPTLIYPRDYITLVLGILTPSRDVAFVYGLGLYVLPLMIVSSWILTVTLLRPYASRIGKKKFWLVVCIPLLYQLVTFVVRDANLITDPAAIRIIQTPLTQFVFGISYQISGLFFALAFLSIARKIKGKNMKTYLLITAIGIFSLFSAIQPGLPFYSAFPPFGLVTALFLGLSSYLLLIGMIGCAAYISKDNEVRREVYKNCVNSDVIGKMGLAEVHRDMERRIFPLANKFRIQDKDMKIQMNLDQEDIRTTIEEVLKRSSIYKIKGRFKAIDTA